MAKPTHNYYDILHVSPNATRDEIRHAFNKMSHAFHPDHHATEEEGNREEFEQEFRLVKEAYECLRDPEKRRTYDQDYFQSNPEDGYAREEPHYDTREDRADAQDPDSGSNPDDGTSAQDESREDIQFEDYAPLERRKPRKIILIAVIAGLALTIATLMVYHVADRHKSTFLKTIPIDPTLQEHLPGIYTITCEGMPQRTGEIAIAPDGYTLTIRSQYAPQEYAFTMGSDGALTSDGWVSASAVYRPSVGTVTITIIFNDETTCKLYK